MSGLDQRRKARREGAVDTTAVTDSTPAAEEWPAIDGELLADDAPGERRIAVPAFPLELLPQPWRDWTRDAARFAGAPVDYVAQAVLASVAAVGGRRVVVAPTPGWQERLRLWLGVVGLPSTGKSPALASVQRLLWMLEGTSNSAPQRRIMLHEGPFARLADTLRRDPRGMVLWRDDVVPCLAPPAGGRSVRQFEPYGLSIVGTLPPADAERLLRADADSAARFLYAWPPSQAFRPLTGLEVPSDTLLQPLGRLLRTVDALGEPHGLLLDIPAAQAFEAFRTRLHAEMRQADGLSAAWLGKGGGMVACLAGVFTLMSWAASDAVDLPLFVDLDAVERAVSLWWAYYRPHATALFSRAGTSEESLRRRVVRWLRTDGRTVISREDVRRTVFNQSINAREADDVIASLVAGGVLREVPHVPTGRAGPRARRWAVNPLLNHLPPCAAARGGARVAGGGVMSSSADAHDTSGPSGHLPNCVLSHSHIVVARGGEGRFSGCHCSSRSHRWRVSSTEWAGLVTGAWKKGGPVARFAG